MKYRHKLVVIEALQFSGDNFRECVNFLDGNFDNTLKLPNVKTLHGVCLVDVGDWIIKGEAGDFWPCKDDIFRAGYEVADD